LNPFRFGIALDYRWFGVEIGLNLPTFTSQKIRKGQTKSSSFRFTINSRKFAFFALYQQFRGFYLNDNRLFYNPLSPLNPLPKRPDILDNIIQTNFLYFFNHHKFSNPAAFGQFERQIKSGGSALIGLGFQHFELKADSSFIPKVNMNKFPNLSQIKSISGSQTFFTFGYVYSFVFHKKWFLTLSASPSIARFDRNEELFDNTKLKNWDLGYRFEARSVLGFNGERLYYGVLYGGFWSNEKLLSGNYLDQTMQNFRFFCGLRFKTKRSLGFLGL